METWSRARAGLIAVVAVLAGGTASYRVLGLSWVDAFYQTLITVSTVGFAEIGQEITPAYRIVTSIIIILGVGVSLYTLGVAFDGLMDGHFRGELERTRMERELGELSDHVIICGYGQVGVAISRDLLAHNSELVVIDRSTEVISQPQEGMTMLPGDATEDEVLVRAGVRRAKALVIALDTDADAMYIIVSARALNPDIYIITRANMRGSGPKLRQAGADRVVNPHEIGGRRMASFILAPAVADFLGETMHDLELELRLDEILVEAGSRLDGAVVYHNELLESVGLSVMAVRHANGKWTHRISEGLTLDPGDTVVALGTPEHHSDAKAWGRTRQGRR